MTLKLKPVSNPSSPFSWNVPSPPPSALQDVLSPTAWLPAKDMKLYGARPLTSTSDVGVFKCKECAKPVLRSCIAEHIEACAIIRAGGKKGKKLDDASKKRKASPSPDEPAKKKNKAAPKVTKGRTKGPVDYDKQCGVINDKGLPCSRSLTCKSHSMGAKRSVLGRSRKYDELLLDWQRANNPNFVEPVKRETKAEKKEKREREKQEKKRLAVEAAAALGLDPVLATKKAAAATSSKKSGKKASAAVRLAEEMRQDHSDDLDDLDSEAEMDELVRSVRTAREAGSIGMPLAAPCDASSWFVQRRERARCCRDHLLNALGSGTAGTGAPGGLIAMGLNRSTSMSLGAGTAAMRM